MRGASTASLAAARERLDTLLQSSSVQPSRVGDDLLAVVGLLDRQPTLRRVLTDVGRTGPDRAGLIQLVLAGQVSSEAVELVAGAVRDRWATPSELSAGLEELGLDAVLASAERAGRLDAVEDELFRFARLVEANPALRSALVDRSAPAESRRGLVHSLLEDKATPETLRLVDHAVLGRRERSLDVALERMSDLAARRRQHEVATVRVARPLPDDQRERLARALAERHGRPVRLNVVVDPDVVGGVLVEMGDEVVDGTVATRLDQARRHIAG